MKRLINLSLLVVLLAFVGCSSDYLDEQPSQFLNVNQLQQAAEVNPDITRGFVDGIYTFMIRSGSGGTTSHADFGHKGYDVMSDMMSSDMALSVSTFGWYRANITEYQAMTDFTRGENFMTWRFYYTVIRSANTVIELQGGADAVPELAENRHILGQALALRAFAYYYLSVYMANDFNPEHEVLPLLTEPIGEGIARSSMADIFALIESDLNTSISLLDDFNRSSKSQINKHVAKGMLAYAIAFTRDVSRMQEVADLTSEVIAESGHTLMSGQEVLGGFNNVQTSGWIWGVPITVDLGVDLVSFWGQVDHFHFSYAWAGDFKTIDNALFAQIPANDIRRLQFKFPGHPNENTGTNASIYPLQPFYKFYAPERVIGGASRPSTSDYVYMRVAEMLLLNAEANAKAGNTGAAQASLSALLSQRVPDASYVNSLSGQDLLDEIFLQTRIELWGEGKTYQAIKRNQRNMVRAGTNHLSNLDLSLPHNADMFTFQIPEREIQDNPNINTQNP